ncbi:MAG: hypothetical protein K0Q87_2326, partial [Neobacillus sp.]|nr:hypothetical protein [Neobacillus sp.]
MRVKRYFKKTAITLLLLLVLFLSSTGTVMASTGEESINEKYGLPVVVLGEALSEAQKDEVRKLFDVDDSSKVKEITVTVEDLVTYINWQSHSNMNSTEKIVLKDTGEGLEIKL